jgi:hypothetical protein
VHNSWCACVCACVCVCVPVGVGGVSCPVCILYAYYNHGILFPRIRVHSQKCIMHY